MRRSVPAIALLAAVALLAFTNPVWLFPNEGHVEYTYERAEITVENGNLTYDGKNSRGFHPANDLAGVDCQPTDEADRLCAFDRYLAEHGPVTVPSEDYAPTPGFTRVGTDYYRRLAYGDENVTYAVERASPRAALETLASDVAVAGDELPDSASLDRRAVVTGEPQTVATHDDDHTGSVWVADGTYYTVVLTDQTVLDRPLVNGLTRNLLAFVGLVAALVAVLLVAKHTEYEY